MHFITLQRLNVAQVYFEQILALTTKFKVDLGSLYLDPPICEVYFAFLKSLQSQ